jgi:F-type H+-transporting ATPase subunit delta
MATAAARRYARAVFELAKEEGHVDAWAARLAELRQVLEHPEALPVLHNRSIPDERRQAAAAALVGDRVGPEGTNLARLLVDAGRLDELEEIIAEFGRLADEDAGRVRATAITAVPLADPDADRLRGDLARRLGREVRLEARVDPAIVGGLVVQVGDRVFDGSVATRLRLLRRQLAEA